MPDSPHLSSVSNTLRVIRQNTRGHTVLPSRQGDRECAALPWCSPSLFAWCSTAGATCSHYMILQPRRLCSFQIPKSCVYTCPSTYRRWVTLALALLRAVYLPFRTSLGKYCLSNSGEVLRQRRGWEFRVMGGTIIQCFPYFHRTVFNFLEVTAVNDEERCTWNTSGRALK